MPKQSRGARVRSAACSLSAIRARKLEIQMQLSCRVSFFNLRRISNEILIKNGEKIYQRGGEYIWGGRGGDARA